MTILIWVLIALGAVILAYFIGRNRGKAAVAAENVKLIELQRQLSAALERGGAWADAEWQQFMTWLKQRYLKL